MSAIYILFDKVAPGHRLALFAPAIFNFAIFALRDTVFGVLLGALTYEMSRDSKRRPLVMLLIFVPLAITRPESAVAIGGAYAFSVYRSSDKSSPLRVLRLITLAGAAIGAIQLIPRALGINRTFGILSFPSELAEFFATRATKNERIDPDETNSNILGGRLVQIPFVARFPIQIAAFFVLPFPFEIRGVALALAFLDSLLFIKLSRKMWVIANQTEKTLLVAYIASVSFFAANYGNLLRLRMPVYFMFLAVFAAHHLSERRAGRLRSVKRLPLEVTSGR